MRRLAALVFVAAPTFNASTTLTGNLSGATAFVSRRPEPHARRIAALDTFCNRPLRREIP